MAVPARGRVNVRFKRQKIRTWGVVLGSGLDPVWIGAVPSVFEIQYEAFQAHQMQQFRPALFSAPLALSTSEING